MPSKQELSAYAKSSRGWPILRPGCRWGRKAKRAHAAPSLGTCDHGHTSLDSRPTDPGSRTTGIVDYRLQMYSWIMERTFVDFNKQVPAKTRIQNSAGEHPKEGDTISSPAPQVPIPRCQVIINAAGPKHARKQKSNRGACQNFENSLVRDRLSQLYSYYESSKLTGPASKH